MPVCDLPHLAAPKSEVNALFDSFDTDGSGTIEYQEINKALRRGADVKLDPSLQVREWGDRGLSLGALEGGDLRCCETVVCPARREA